MEAVGTRVWLRPARDVDEPFVFEVFSTTWQHAVAAMPNPDLVQHFLRIQYTAENRRFSNRFPGHERYVVMAGDKAVGRLLLDRSEAMLHIVDMTLLPAFRSLGIGRALLAETLHEAAATGRQVSLRVARGNRRAVSLYEQVGFRLVTMDDLDAYLEWTPDATS